MNKQSLRKKSITLSKKDRNLIERFEAAYNAIDHHLRKVLRKKKGVRFSELVREYSHDRLFRAKESDFLRIIGHLRNALIHGKTEPHNYLAVPAPAIVEHMEKILFRLHHPELVIPIFQKNVVTVSLKETLVNVLRKISDNDFSQFPVYKKNNFKGLLTENGITRWLSHHIHRELKSVNLDNVLVVELLTEEEPRQNLVFVDKKKTVDEIKELFAINGLLEAVLISENGNENEELMGIATRWDILRLK